MIRGDEELPEAWREAAGNDATPERELAAILPEVLGRKDRAAGLARLMGAVSQLPLRYAPFVVRTAALWKVSEQRVDRIFADSARWADWKRTPLPGVRILPVADDENGAHTFMVRFAPGVRFPRHRHIGSEALLVLEGSYTDTLGRAVRPGDLHEMASGTEHGFAVAKDGPCIGAVLQHGREFTGPFMRLLAMVFDRKARR
jgi:quercetin dioxygenase-like cupin family protein